MEIDLENLRNQEGKSIHVDYMGSCRFDAFPLLKVILDDFERPQEFAEMLEQLLQADLKSCWQEQRPVDSSLLDRQYFIRALIDSLKAGVIESPLKINQDGIIE